MTTGGYKKAPYSGIPDHVESLRAGQAIVAGDEGQLPMVEPVETLRTWDEQRVVRVQERCANTGRSLGTSDGG
jgi:hypothetical protein